MLKRKLERSFFQAGGAARLFLGKRRGCSGRNRKLSHLRFSPKRALFTPGLTFSFFSLLIFRLSAENPWQQKENDDQSDLVRLLHLSENARRTNKNVTRFMLRAGLRREELSDIACDAQRLKFRLEILEAHYFRSVRSRMERK